MGIKQIKNYVFAAALFFLLIVFGGTVNAQAVSVNLNMISGPFRILAPATINFASITASAGFQEAAATVSKIYVSDLRGEGTGWNASLIASSLGIAGENALVERVSGSSASVFSHRDITVSGYYDGFDSSVNSYSRDDGLGQNYASSFTIAIQEVVNGMPTKVNIAKPSGIALNNVDVANAFFSFNGLTVAFLNAGFAAGDVFRITVDHFPATALNIITSDVVASSSHSIVSNPSLNIIPGTVTHRSILADFGGGMGGTEFADRLSWLIHPRPLAGSYRTTLTYTLQ